MARLRLALLRNLCCRFQVVDKSVRNYDVVSYHRGNPKGFPLFLVAGGGLVSSVIYTIHPNPPLIRRACSKVKPCIASQFER